MKIKKKKLKALLYKETRETGMSHWLVSKIMKALKQKENR